MIFCSNCGMSAKEIAKFCWQCGSPICIEPKEIGGYVRLASSVPELAGGAKATPDELAPVISWPDEFELVNLRDGKTETTIPDSIADSFFPYHESSFVFKRKLPLQDSPLTVLRLAVFVIVQSEGPVHEFEVVRRIATMWLMRRAGPKCKDAAFIGLAGAKKAGWLVNDGPFWQQSGVECARLRFRVGESTKDIDLISPSEIAAGVAHILKTTPLRKLNALAAEAARHAGFLRAKPEVVKRIAAVISADSRLAIEADGAVSLRTQFEA